MHILLDIFHIPYEGTDTSVLGVFETQILAEEAMLKHYTDRPKDENNQTPTKENDWTYYDRYDTGQYEIVSVNLNQLCNY